MFIETEKPKHTKLQRRDILNMIPYVDDEEMKEIEKIFGDPEKYKDQQFIKLDL